VERDKPKKSESVGHNLCRSCHGNKKGGIFYFFYFFHQTS
jgi:hypothetical protein